MSHKLYALESNEDVYNAVLEEAKRNASEYILDPRYPSAIAYMVAVVHKTLGYSPRLYFPSRDVEPVEPMDVMYKSIGISSRLDIVLEERSIGGYREAVLVDTTPSPIDYSSFQKIGIGKITVYRVVEDKEPLTRYLDNNEIIYLSKKVYEKIRSYYERKQQLTIALKAPALLGYLLGYQIGHIDHTILYYSTVYGRYIEVCVKELLTRATQILS